MRTLGRGAPRSNGTDALVLDSPSLALARVRGAALAELEQLGNLDAELVARLLARRAEANS